MKYNFFIITTLLDTLLLFTLSIMSTKITSILTLVSTFGGLGSASVLPSHISGLLVGPSIVQIKPALQNVFPAENFNRNVTTSWWDTNVIDGPPSSSASKLLSSLKQANFIALDDRFYKVRLT
jgi:hypothetical protein